MDKYFRNVFCLIVVGLWSFNVYGETRLVTVEFESFDTAIQVDEDFLPCVKIMNELASKQNIKILVQQSFRKGNEKVTNAIVVPVKNSNHLVGHALDINILYDNKYYTSKILNKYSELPQPIKSFIIECRLNGIRWGGDFSIQDSVHFDDNLSIHDPEKYEELYRKYQE